MHERRQRRPVNKSSSLRSHLTVNGWQYVNTVYVCHGVKQAHYKHPITGWTARELHRGPTNTYMGLLVSDEAGNPQGLVARVTDLP